MGEVTSMRDTIKGLAVVIGMVIFIFCFYAVFINLTLYRSLIPPRLEIGQCWRNNSEDPFEKPGDTFKVLEMRGDYVLYGWMYSGKMLTGSCKKRTFMAFAQQVSCEEFSRTANE
jgi:hypothetical protein